MCEMDIGIEVERWVFFCTFYCLSQREVKSQKKYSGTRSRRMGDGCGVEMKDQGSRIKKEEEEYEIERYLQIEGSSYGEYGV